MEQTLGQRRVKAEFNPAKNDLVDQIKNKSAELIDLIEKLTIQDSIGNATDVLSGEKLRLIALAQDAYEEAALWAVKACFTD